MSNTAKKRKIGSRACDGCKIRKVRCTEVPPCDRCVNVGIACTFHKMQATRGPRSLRAKTMRQIRVAQERAKGKEDEVERGAGDFFGLAGMMSGAGTGYADVHVGVGDDGTERDGYPSTGGYPGEPQAHSQPHQQPAAATWEGSRRSLGIPVASLVLRLCIYRLRLFPVWPIVAVEEVIAALQRDSEDVEMYALANAVGAATMAQLKLSSTDQHHNHNMRGDLDINDTVTADMMEAECQHARGLLGRHDAANLNMLRTSFFLHIYHENQCPGGTRSLLYLREAITMAQIMGLHRHTTYPYLPVAEQQMRRRILWLLFVTERGVAMLHKLPVVLMSGNKLPSLDGCDGEDEAHILPAFKKLVNLFWIFDQSGAFDLIQSSEDELDSGAGQTGANILDALQRRLQEVPVDMEQGSNDVQKADICVTRQWMQVLLWRATLNQYHCHSQYGNRSHRRSPSSALTTDSTAASLTRPIQIAKEFLELVSRLPETALEAHGPAIEFKIYDIASAVTDAIASRFRQPRSSHQSMDLQPADILLRLQKMLASCRGGNKSLLASLCARIAQVEARPALLMGVESEMSPMGNGRRIEEVREEDERHRQGWVESRHDGHRYSDVNRPLSSGSSQWFSLVAAAELEQFSAQTQLIGNSPVVPSTEQHNQSMPVSSPSLGMNYLVNSLSWQPLELLGQLSNLDGWMGEDMPSPNAMNMLPVGSEGWSPGLMQR